MGGEQNKDVASNLGGIGGEQNENVASDLGGVRADAIRLHQTLIL
jgi:hypothetical protein